MSSSKTFGAITSPGAASFVGAIMVGTKMGSILCANAFLQARFKELISSAAECGNADALPSMSTVQETHLCPFTNNFLPMVSTTFESINNGISSGNNVTLHSDSNIVFQLQLASDFINDVKLSVKLPSVECACYAQVFPPESSAEYVFGLVHKYLTFGDDTTRGDIAQVNGTGSYRIGSRIDDIEDYDKVSPYGYFFGFSRKDGEIIPIQAKLTVPTSTTSTSVEKLATGLAQWYSMSVGLIDEWLLDTSGETIKTKYPQTIKVDNIPLSKFICSTTGFVSYTPYSLADFKKYFINFSLLQPSKVFRGHRELQSNNNCSLGISNDYYKVKNDVGFIDRPLNGLIKKISFVVGNSELDSYDDFTMKVEQELYTLPNKRTAMYELLGQEQPLKAYGPSYEVNPIREVNTATLANTSRSNRGSNRLGSSRNWGSAMRQCYTLYSGLQTAETRKNSTVVSTNLNFWFNKSMSHALATVAIPYGQKNINVDVRSINSILYEETVTSIRFTQLNSTNSINFITPDTIDEETAQPITWSANSIPNSKIIYRPFRNETNNFVALDQPQITIDVCSVYVDPMIHLLYLKKIGFNLVTVHRCENYPLNLNTTEAKIDLSTLKWCVPTLAFSVFPAINNDVSNPYRRQTWDVPAIVVPQNSEIKHITAINMIDNVSVRESGETEIVNQMPHVTTVITHSTDIMPAICLQEYPILDSAYLDSHGYKIRGGPIDDFDKYQATVRGGINITASNGINIINFSIKSDPDQPTGSFNFSKAKNTNLYIKPSDKIDFLDDYYDNTQVNVRVCALAYNILLIAAGNAIMRFAT